MIRSLAIRAIYFPFALVLYWAGFRFLKLTASQRIGHLAADIDFVLKRNVLIGGTGKKFVLLIQNEERVANFCLLDYWKDHLHAFHTPRPWKLLKPFLKFGFLRVDVMGSTVAPNASSLYHKVLRDWGERPPLLALREEHRRRGEAVLRKLGVPEGAWFVCVHSREGGYSPGDEALHSYRNSRISSYLSAMQEIVDRGGWCIRLGDGTMEPLPARPGIVDYALSEHKSDWMDVFLCASCRFFLGNSSGLFLVSTVFGVPSALTNMTPVSAVFPPSPADIAIPKFVKSDGAIMNFCEALSLPMADYREAGQFAADGIELVDNSSEDIMGVAIEMLDRLDSSGGDGNASAKPIERRFRAHMRKGHYSYFSEGRIAGSFLAKHREHF